MTDMSGPNMAEIVIVNSIGIFLMIRLLIVRSNDLQDHYPWEKLFSAMIWMTIIGCTGEVLSFLIDGRQFPFCRILNYILNSACFLCTSTVGYLWCLFMEYRVFNSPVRVRRASRLLAIPLVFDYILCVISLKTGIIFSISADNVYHRGGLVAISYLLLFFYFIYSLCLTDISKENGLYLKTMSSLTFVVPCMIGTLVQGLFYGITLGWTSVAVAFVHVYQQTQFLNFYTDSLSMLYNRRYLDRVTRQFTHAALPNLYGIMIDVNDFKHINDVYGHAAGDRAIQHIAGILSQSISSSTLAIRYAGDEFILLLRTDDPDVVTGLIRRVEKEAEEWNESHVEPYTLSFAMGCSHFDPTSMTADELLTEMDRKMYENKHDHYLKRGGRNPRETEEAHQ